MRANINREHFKTTPVPGKCSVNSCTLVKSHTLRLSLLVCLLMLSACQTTPSTPRPDPALLLLASVADDVSQITRRVSELQQVEQPRSFEPRLRDARLNTPIKVIDFVGNPEIILSEICRRLGYRFITTRHTSDAPPFPAVVTIRANNRPAIEVIRSIGAQVGNSVVVTVSEKLSEIRLEYL